MLLRSLILSSFLAFTVASFSTADAVSKRTVESRIGEAKRLFERQQSSSDTRIPASILQDAIGIIIVKQVKGGFIFGAKGGHGIAFAKNQESGKWSAPAFLKSGEGSVGLQIGGQSLDTIYVIMNQEGLDILEESRFRVGADAAAAVGPAGRGAEAKIGPEVAIYSYSRARGLFAGASIEGGALWNDTDANETMYGERYNSAEILYGDKPVPEKAKGLIELFERYSK